MSKTLSDAVRTLFGVTQHHKARYIGFSFVTFLAEAEHSSWDGMDSRDKAAVGRLLEDFSRWLEHDHERDYVFTGRTYLTLDRNEDWKK